MDDIRGLKPFLVFAPNWKLIALVAVAILAATAVFVWWRRRPRPEAAEGPRVVIEGPPLSVRQQLDELKGRRLIEKGRVRDFHAGLSTIVRGYLGGRYGLPGRRLTTTELLAALGGCELPPATRTLIAEFLSSCDLAKFADAQASKAEMEVRLANAYALVDQLGDAAVPVDGHDDEPSEATDVLG